MSINKRREEAWALINKFQRGEEVTTTEVIAELIWALASLRALQELVEERLRPIGEDLHD
jgi:hypothetical protein